MVTAQSIPSNGSGVSSAGGMRTWSMTWMTPFDAGTSASVTFAIVVPTMTAPLAT